MINRPAGQNALYEILGLTGPLPHTLSHTLPGESRRTTIIDRHATQEYHPLSAATDGSLRDNLRFAFKHEPLDLRIVHAALAAMGAADIAAWVREEPTGRYSRLAWFFFERLTAQTIDLPSVANAVYVDALNPKRHFVAASTKSSRHHINDNLLGDGDLCPILRRTRPLELAISSALDVQVRDIAAHYAPGMLRRATDYLYTRETRSSFDIEGDTLSANRQELFLQALRKAPQFNPQSKSELIALQRSIVDTRFGVSDWRGDQMYVSTRSQRGKEHVHYICPKPTDVPDLMTGLQTLSGRVLSSPELDPVLAATLVSFAFVFIHPFDDGNGRIHRFLIHNILAKRGFTPDGIIFPVSAAILRDIDRYYQVLDRFSQPIKPSIAWQFYGDDEIEVGNETRDLYRFFDATPFAEYLYEIVADTIRVDFQKELDYLTLYDAAFVAVQNIADMPDRDVSLMVRLCLQNVGKLSRAKRDRFPLLRDDEIGAMEEAIQALMQASSPPPNSK